MSKENKCDHKTPMARKHKRQQIFFSRTAVLLLPDSFLSKL